MKEVMLTLIGPDRTGIVARLAAIAGRTGGNWLDSRMIRMGGYFSGILRISLPDERLSEFGREVGLFMEEEGYHFSIQAAELPRPEIEDALTAELTVSGQDHPGIVHAIFKACQENEVNIEELRTGLQAAPWSGTPVFEAHARLLIPRAVDLDGLQGNLESIAADLMVEVDLKS